MSTTAGGIGWTTTQLAERFGTSVSTIRRAVDQLPDGAVVRVGLHRLLLAGRLGELEELLRQQGRLPAGAATPA